MKRFTMQHPYSPPGDCRFKGTLERDAKNRLYDSRLRTALLRMRPGRDERDFRAVEALAALKITSRLMHQLIDRWAEKHGLSEGRLHALFQLGRADGHMLPLGELADNLDVTPRNVTGLIDHLEEDGMVERVPDREDRRSISARLTAAGLQKLESIRKEAFDAQVPLVRDFSAEDLELFRHLCLRIVENITARVPMATGAGS
jgi:DNA-binding MarR family transcriptional regulator